jgi:DNA-binding NarL/FixJ family response regulator
MTHNRMSSGQVKPTTVAIVEDDARVRESLSLVISRAEGFAIAGTYPDAESALAGIPRLHPDVVLMDIRLPGMSGIECVRALKARLPGARVVMLTVYDEGSSLLESLKAGASGYLLKRTPAAKILEAINEAKLGGMPMTRQMAGKVAQYFHGLGTAMNDVQQLTPREKETLAQLADGYRYKEIADHLGISLDTVREYVRSIYDKLHVSSRTEAVVKYLGR